MASTDTETTCPRCKKNPADKWCRSRTDNTTRLCNPCGTAESMEDHLTQRITPQAEWPVKPPTVTRDLKMSELTEGMVIEHYGMELLLTDRQEIDLDPNGMHDADVAEGLKAAGHPLKTFWFTGLIQNVDEVNKRGLVPPSYRRGDKWHVQGNDLVTHRVISAPELTDQKEN